MILQIIGGVAIAVDAFAAGWWAARKWPKVQPVEVAKQIGDEAHARVDQLSQDYRDISKEVTERIDALRSSPAAAPAPAPAPAAPPAAPAPAPAAPPAAPAPEAAVAKVSAALSPEAPVHADLDAQAQAAQ